MEEKTMSLKSLLLIYTLYINSVSAAPKSFRDDPTTLPLSTNGDKLAQPITWKLPRQPQTTTLGKLKSTFLKNILPHTVRQLRQLYQVLNEDSLLDKLQANIDSLEESPPEKTVPGFYTWLLAQDRKDVFRTMENLDECLKHFQKWLNKQDIWNDELIYAVQYSSEKKGDNEETQDKVSTAKFLFDLVKIVWRIGYKNGYRIGELIHFLDPDGSKLWRIFSVNIGVNMVLNNERAQKILMPQVADWILEQDPETLRHWIEAGDGQLEKIFKWIDSNEY